MSDTDPAALTFALAYLICLIAAISYVVTTRPKKP